jgi:hypothetical protein
MRHTRTEWKLGQKKNELKDNLITRLYENSVSSVYNWDLKRDYREAEV